VAEPGMSWDQIVKINNDMVRLEMSIKMLDEKVDENNRKIGELYEAQRDTQIIIERGKTVVYLLSGLGVIAGFVITLGKEILLKMWRP
jgi:hypothetical protein